MSSSAVGARNSTGNRSPLGTLWILYGIIRPVAALLLFLYSGTATVMFGALLARTPKSFHAHEHFPPHLSGDHNSRGPRRALRNICGIGAARRKSLGAHPFSRRGFPVTL